MDIYIPLDSHTVATGTGCVYNVAQGSHTVYLRTFSWRILHTLCNSFFDVFMLIQRNWIWTLERAVANYDKNLPEGHNMGQGPIIPGQLTR